jgi:hypothetical protein
MILLFFVYYLQFEQLAEPVDDVLQKAFILKFAKRSKIAIKVVKNEE